MVNPELRKKLKKVDTVITSLGYYFDLKYDSLFISPINDDYDSIENWVRMYMHKKYSKNSTHCKLYFHAEPCRLSGGSDFLYCGKAEQICAYWKKLLNACNLLNELMIEGDSLEIKECVRDILARKRK